MSGMNRNAIRKVIVERLGEEYSSLEKSCSADSVPCYYHVVTENGGVSCFTSNVGVPLDRSTIPLSGTSVFPNKESISKFVEKWKIVTGVAGVNISGMTPDEVKASEIQMKKEAQDFGVGGAKDTGFWLLYGIVKDLLKAKSLSLSQLRKMLSQLEWGAALTFDEVKKLPKMNEYEENPFEQPIWVHLKDGIDRTPLLVYWRNRDQPETTAMDVFNFVKQVDAEGKSRILYSVSKKTGSEGQWFTEDNSEQPDFGKSYFVPISTHCYGVVTVGEKIDLSKKIERAGDIEFLTDRANKEEYAEIVPVGSILGKITLSPNIDNTGLGDMRGCARWDIPAALRKCLQSAVVWNQQIGGAGTDTAEISGKYYFDCETEMSLFGSTEYPCPFDHPEQLQKVYEYLKETSFFETL
jgi:hypothetical protein